MKRWVIPSLNNTFNSLIHCIYIFHIKKPINLTIGIKNLRFKPAYNPYTEPSMEIFSYHEGIKTYYTYYILNYTKSTRSYLQLVLKLGLGKWVEIGNSGMFRPEMLEPMGLDPEIRVIAWGLGLERPAMIKYGLENIREVKLPS